MNLPAVLQLSYWFTVYPAPFMPIVDRVILIFMSAHVLAGIGVLAYRAFGKGIQKEYKRLMKRYAEMLLIAGVTGLMLYVFTWQQIPYLSMRILYAVWAFGFAFWAWSIVRFQRIELPMIREKRAQEEERTRWFPKKKK